MEKFREKFHNFIENKFLIVSIILFVALSFALFFGIWNYPVLDFDEARHAVDGYEMIAYHSPVVNYYNGEIDYYNLKPPLSYWMVSFFYLIFGYNPFALRFYASFFSLVGCIILFFYVKHKYGKVSALLSIFAFLGCVNLFAYHGVRSGDADGLFIFLFIVAYVSLALSSENPNWIFLSGFMFALMFLTKSFHAFCFVPIVFFYLLFTKGFKNVGWWRLILFFVVALLPIFLWGLWRYQYDGWTFIEKMWTFDLFRRTTEGGFEGQKSTIFYYLRALPFNPPLLVSAVFCVIYLIIKIKNKDWHFSNDALLVMISVVCVFGLFSLSKTRLDWYVNVGYVPLCIALSVLLPKFFNLILVNKPKLDKLTKVIRIAVPCVLFLSALGSMTWSVVSPLFFKMDEINTILRTSNIERGKMIYFTNKSMPTQSYLVTMEYTFDGRMHIGEFADWETATDDGYLIAETSSLPANYEVTYTVKRQTENYTLLAH